MTFRDVPISEFLTIFLPCLVVVLALTHKDSSDKLIWALGPLVLGLGLGAAWVFNTYGPTVGTESYEPMRTYFVSAFLGIATPFLAKKHRAYLLNKAEPEGTE